MESSSFGRAAAFIETAAISGNVRWLKGRLPGDGLFMAVVKSDGYGHGVLIAAKAALQGGADRLGVATLEEAVELRDGGLTAPLQVLSGLIAGEEEQAAAIPGLIPTIFTSQTALALADAAERAGKRVDVHMKIDTGMNRIGVKPADAVALAGEISGLPSLRLEGTMTHLACADSIETASTEAQLSLFRETLEAMREAGIEPGIRHAANSAAIIDHPASHLDMVRAGIAIYGLSPFAEAERKPTALRPALSLRSRIVLVKRVPAGSPVSYCGTYVTERETSLATVPIGYGDGLSRLLSGRGAVLIGGRRCPIRGRVCMDQLVVEIGDGDAKVGDEAVIIGRDGAEEITLEEIAGLSGTIPYESACRLRGRVPRLPV